MTTKNPTTQPAPADAQTGRLLGAEEKAVCERVAAGDSLNSRRARALLAIDGGATQVEASNQAGLTRGQMQYCLRIFRQQGLTIFPDAAPEPVAQTEPAPEFVSEPDPTPASEPVASDGGTETMVGKPRNKAGAKTGKGKKGARKKKKSGKKKKEGKKGRKSKSAKSSRKKDRKPKPGKSSRKKKRGKNDKHGAKKRKKKSKR
jgi:hypothetical protein